MDIAHQNIPEAASPVHLNKPPSCGRRSDTSSPTTFRVAAIPAKYAQYISCDSRVLTHANAFGKASKLDGGNAKTIVAHIDANDSMNSITGTSVRRNARTSVAIRKRLL